MSTTQQEQTRAAAPQEYLLEMRGITKAFAGVQALKGVDFYVRPGTVHALMGENGAGKSTLMKCLFGIYHKDEGTIKLRGQEVNFQSPHEALLNGISMVHQELEQVPGPGEVLVKVRASGLCVSDIHIQDGKVGTVHLPYTPGHEMAGVIVAVGKGVDPARIGEHISAAIDIICGECEFCRTGRTNLCRSLVRIGFERDGSHEEYCVIPAKNAFTVNPTIPFEEITGIPDAVGCMYNGLKNQAKLGIGQTLLILGVGGLGMNAIQIAKLMGATVYATSRKADKLEVAKQMGADAVIDTSCEDLRTRVAELTNGRGVDVVLDNIGLEWSINEGVYMVRPGGKVLVCGYISEDFKVNYQEVMKFEKEILGMRGMTRQDMAEVVELVNQRKIVPYVYKTVPFEQINEALGLLRDGKTKGRVVLLFPED